MFLPGYGPIAIADHCAMQSIGQTWVLASIGAVVEMGIEYIETTAHGVQAMPCCMHPRYFRCSLIGLLVYFKWKLVHFFLPGFQKGRDIKSS
jgi:hypothetical protein